MTLTFVLSLSSHPPSKGALGMERGEGEEGRPGSGSLVSVGSRLPTACRMQAVDTACVVVSATGRWCSINFLLSRFEQCLLCTALQSKHSHVEGRRSLPFRPQHQHARPPRYVWGCEGRKQGFSFWRFVSRPTPSQVAWAASSQKLR